MGAFLELISQLIKKLNNERPKEHRTRCLQNPDPPLTRHKIPWRKVKLYKGKNDTMKTILRMVDKWEACTNCSTISPEDRLFLNPMVPVAQNVQPILHPTLKKRVSGQHKTSFRSEHQILRHAIGIIGRITQGMLLLLPKG